MVVPKRERRYAGLTAAERRDGRRRRILAAALELFGGGGYHRTTVEHLCAESGVTARHFYEVFAGRETVLVELVDEIALDAALAVSAAVDASDGTAESMVRAGVGAYVHAMVDDPRRGRVVCIETRGVSLVLDRQRRQINELYAFSVAQACRQLGEARGASDAELFVAVTVLVSGTMDLITEWIVRADRPPLSTAELIEVLVHVWRGVGDAPETTAHRPAVRGGARAWRWSMEAPD